MVPEKIAKSHLVKLTRMLDDIARASKDLGALRVAYQCIAAACLPDAKADPGGAGQTCPPGQLQAQRCGEIINEHVRLKSLIEEALSLGTDGKQVAALQSSLDALEDERDALDFDLRTAQRALAMRQPLELGTTP